MRVTPITAIEGGANAGGYRTGVTRAQRWAGKGATRAARWKPASAPENAASIDLGLYGAPSKFGEFPRYGSFSEKV